MEVIFCELPYVRGSKIDNIVTYAMLAAKFNAELFAA